MRWSDCGGVAVIEPCSPQQYLKRFPLPQGQGLLREIICDVKWIKLSYALSSFRDYMLKHPKRNFVILRNVDLSIKIEQYIFLVFHRCHNSLACRVSHGTP